MKKSVETQLLGFLSTNPSVWASGTLQRMEWFNRNGTLATPRSIVRRLEENTCTPDNPKGVLTVTYDPHGAAQYQIKQEHIYKKPVYYVPHPITGVKITTEEYAAL